MTSDIAQANLYPSETQKLIIDKIIDFNMFEDNYFKDVCIITKKEAKKNFPEFGQTGFYSWIESEKKNSLSIRIVQADENSDEDDIIDCVRVNLNADFEIDIENNYIFLPNIGAVKMKFTEDYTTDCKIIGLLLRRINKSYQLIIVYESDD